MQDPVTIAAERSARYIGREPGRTYGLATQGGEPEGLLAAGGTGAAAGAIASTVQSLVGWVIAEAFLPRGHDNNIAPRFVNRLLRRSGTPSHPVLEWIGGTLFHYGYGLGWGTVYGVVRQRTPVPPLGLGAMFAGLIYLLAFSEVGLGTYTGTEHPPERRPWYKQLSLVSVVLAYVVPLVATYERLAPPAPQSR